MLKRILLNTGQVLAVLAVIGGLFTLAFLGSNWLLGAFAIAFISVGGMLVFYIGRALKQGKLPGRLGTQTFRQESPFPFWFQLGLYSLFAIFLFFIGLFLLGLAPDWFKAVFRSMPSHPA